MDLSVEASQDEAELIRAALRGNGAAWEALVRTHQEPVFRYAYLIQGDRDEAEDTAQETFIRAYRALERFDISRPLRPWLLSIAANLARNRFRSLGRYVTALRRMVIENPGRSTSVESLSIEQIDAQSLWQALQKMDAADRQVIYLRFFLELSVEETAQAMSTAEGTIKSRLHRALGRLRTIIERDYPNLREGWTG
jgi:RNA polymerase sigma-70 factor (ECF subfamily)